jgi:hypothetical protein
MKNNKLDELIEYSVKESKNKIDLVAEEVVTSKYVRLLFHGLISVMVGGLAWWCVAFSIVYFADIRGSAQGIIAIAAIPVAAFVTWISFKKFLNKLK